VASECKQARLSKDAHTIPNEMMSERVIGRLLLLMIFISIYGVVRVLSFSKNWQPVEEKRHLNISHHDVC